jgi:hypothetical protein
MFWLTESMPAIVAMVMPLGASAESWAAEYCVMNMWSTA